MATGPTWTLFDSCRYGDGECTCRNAVKYDNDYSDCGVCGHPLLFHSAVKIVMNGTTIIDQQPSSSSSSTTPAKTKSNNQPPQPPIKNPTKLSSTKLNKQPMQKNLFVKRVYIISNEEEKQKGVNLKQMLPYVLAQKKKEGVFEENIKITDQLDANILWQSFIIELFGIIDDKENYSPFQKYANKMLKNGKFIVLLNQSKQSGKVIATEYSDEKGPENKELFLALISNTFYLYHEESDTKKRTHKDEISLLSDNEDDDDDKNFDYNPNTYSKTTSGERTEQSLLDEARGRSLRMFEEEVAEEERLKEKEIEAREFKEFQQQKKTKTIAEAAEAKKKSNEIFALINETEQLAEAGKKN